MRNGQIVRIKCENVLTYDFIEIYPRDKLNLIIGVNGSGKSTLISAIILGLGGNPSVVGRASELSKYVKVGRTQATIEIELYNQEGNDIITRQYNTNNDSRFLLNGRKIPIEKIHKLMRKYHIQINNLCQILPQEKLEQFAKMNDQERLENTLKTVGNPKLSSKLEELKNSKGMHAEIRRKVELLNKDLLEATNKKDSLEAEAKLVREKEFLIECFRLLKQRKAWQYYFHIKQAENKIIVILNVRKDICQNISKVLRKCNNDAQSSFSNVLNQTQIVNKIKNELESIHLTQTKKKLNEISISTENMSDIKSGFTQKISKYKNQETDIKKLKDKINNLKQNLCDVDQIDFQIFNVSQQIQVKMKEVQTFEHSKEMLNFNLENKTSELNAINHQLSKANDFATHKMKLLERCFNDSWKGVKWLEENKHLFEDTVYGPMFLYINVNNVNNAKYVEDCISHRDLTAFICKSRKDTAKLLKVLKDEKDLRINVVTALDDNINIPCPKYPIEKLRKYGFYSYVADFLEGPDIILKFLIMSYSLHNTPVGSKVTCDYSDQIPADIRLYFTDTFRISSKIVHETGEKIESSSEIHDPSFLKINVNLTDSDELHNRKQRIETEIANIQKECKELENKVATGDEKINELNKMVHTLKNQKIGQAQCHTMIKDKTHELRVLENSVIDINVEKNKYHLQLRLKLQEISNKFIELSNLFKNLIECFMRYQREKINKEQAEKIHEKNACVIMEFVKNVKKEVDSLKKLESKKKALSKFAESLKQWALKQTNGIDPRTVRFKRRKMFFELCDNIAVLQRLMNKYQAKINCLGSSNEGFRVYLDYKKYVKEVNRLKAKIEKKEKTLLQYSEHINQVKQEWTKEVEQLVQTININFSRFFANMNCAGEVSLYTGNPNEEDYNKYGIHIKVKFRDNQDLQILSAQVQSGGERAVSVAIYLLSLQELTTVPFRCIDEINQGMDADNERRIFNLISKATEQENCTQYFLLTPKLLLNLSYTKYMNIFCIFNGIGSVSHNKALNVLNRNSQRN